MEVDWFSPVVQPQKVNNNTLALWGSHISCAFCGAEEAAHQRENKKKYYKEKDK